MPHDLAVRRRTNKEFSWNGPPCRLKVAKLPRFDSGVFLDATQLRAMVTGSTGADSFLFDAALPGDVERITECVVVDDAMQLENAVFTAL